ncbi:NSFL1 cofactor p47-like isoform X2 [Odontomachus brunneus]|uniref:NSFL1 cofactor p47-like isoform X2 n=1 Tax=Odontomachus brunneus TaxID=486640 RepID=UPI0013F1EB1D|nr:NSFL1 cofactor p47-like isoform X2 [Odontomachus brunneus]
MANHDELVSQFADVTGVEAERAQFFLESSAWHLEVALASFYENDEAPALVTEPVDDTEEAAGFQDNTADTMSENTKSDAEESKGAKPKPKVSFGSLSVIKYKDSSSDDEEGQAFYAGGSEHSGQQVLGPGKKKKKDIISDMFKSCQSQSLAVEPTKMGGQQRPNTFSGTGYKLGQTSSDSEVIGADADQQSSSGLVILKLWKDGFTINDSEIRSYSEPENREFLAAVKRGEVPAEIRQQVQGADLRLDMEDHRHEAYVPTKAKVKAFSGKGHMLGSPSPATVGMTVPADPADQAANEAQAKKELNVDTSQPTTTIQIRLVDGSTVRAQFNLTHTVSDIRRYIITMRPQYALRDFSLLTMYPTKELTEDKTIEEAGLQSSAIMQRLK